MLKKEEMSFTTPDSTQNIKNRGLFFSRLPRSYISFLFGLFISRLGDSLYIFAIPWISYEITRSAVVMGSMYAISVLPIILFGPIVGVFVDRWDRRKLMITTDVLRAFLIGLIPILHLMGHLQLWHLYVISFILTVLSLMFDVSTVTSIPNIVGKKLTEANAMYQLVNQSADLAGPIVAGCFIALVGGYNTLWLDVISFGATILVVLRLKNLGKNVTSSHVGSVLREMKDGLRWLICDRLNLTLSLQAMVGNFGASAAFATLMYYLLSTLSLDSQQSSINYSLIGAGGLLGSLIAVPLEKLFRRGILIPLLLTVGVIGCSLATMSNYWLVPGIALGIVTTCNTAWNAIVQSIRQETVPSEMLGRVLGFSRVFTRLAMPLGAMVGGLISNSFSPVAVFAVAAIAKVLEVVIALASPIRKL